MEERLKKPVPAENKASQDDQMDVDNDTLKKDEGSSAKEEKAMDTEDSVRKFSVI